MRAMSFLLDDSREFAPGSIEVLVNYSVIELPGMIHFAPGVLHSALDHRIGILTPRAHAPLELLDGRGQDEDADAIGIERAHLARALPVDLEDQVLAALHRVEDHLLRGAVAVAVYLGALEEFAPLAHGEEGGVVDVVVVDPFLLAAARRARGVGNRDLQARVVLHHRVDERSLAGARRRGDDEKTPFPIQCSAPARGSARSGP